MSEYYKNIVEYYDYVQSIVSNAGLIAQSKKILVRPLKKNKLKGIISTDDLILNDGAKFMFYEEVELLDREVTRIKYNYHFANLTGYYFRYDKDPASVRPLA